MFERVIKYGEKVNKVCQDYRISRVNFYKWLRRYQEVSSEKRLEAMQNRMPKVEHYYQQSPELYEQAVLDVAAQYPQFGVERIVKALPVIAGEPIVGYHGVQKILERNSLNTYEQRLTYAQTQITLITRLISVFEGLGTRFIVLPIETRAKIISFASVVFAAGLTTTIILGFFGYIATVAVGIPPAARIGLGFATVALFVGSLFFAYSMKYYLTLAIVLSFSRQPAEEGGFSVSLGGRVNGNHQNNNGNGGWFRKIFGLENGNGNGNGKNGKIIQAGGLQPSLDHVKLKSYPFVSIHLPFYNEKKVAERILSACTSMDYPHYEVIVCDDSTDETVQIVQRYAKEHNRENPQGPKIKILHRSNREGFKGGALKYAVENMDPRTEFCVVFDADFIPYPDTLEMFVKYFKVNNNSTENYTKSNIAVVGGYQWHVLNKSENWVTRGVRTEYAGSYVIERPGTEILGLLKQISGSVYMIRADVLKKIGWGTSITEDFQLTLKLYEQGYKVIYTPYVQAPSECVSTLKRLIRQRMRWAEGHSHCIKEMFFRLILSPKLTLPEKLELLYLSPYYLQAFFFLLGTFSWLMAETVFRARLPFWTSLWGWSLVLTNFFSLPLVNAVGLFLEESEEKDYLGILSFVALSYILVPFQAYASVKGFLEKQEGPWFRTPKTGRITDIFTRGKFYRWVAGILPGRRSASAAAYSRITGDELQMRNNPYLALATANNQFSNFKIRPRHIRWLGNVVFSLFIFLTSALIVFAPLIPLTQSTMAQGPGRLMTVGEAMEAQEPKEEEITTPRSFHFPTASGETLEMIFHKEPRVRIKIGDKELEIMTLEIEGVGRAEPKHSLIIGNREVCYEEIVPGVDLIYRFGPDGFREEFVLKRFVPLTSVRQRAILKEVKVVNPSPTVFGFYDEEGREVFRFGEAYLFEKENPGEDSHDVAMTLSEEAIGYDLEKRIGGEGLSWLADPNRAYPVVLDPTTIIGSGIIDTEAEWGGNQRKLVYMTVVSRYYAVANDAYSIQFFRSDDSTGGSFTQLSDIDNDNDDNDPSLSVEGNNIWVVWHDNSGDNLEFRRIVVSAGPSESIEAVCSGPDHGNSLASDDNQIAVGNTLIYVGNDDDPDIYKVTKSEYVPTPASCTSADFTLITNTADSPTAASVMIFKIVGTGDSLHAVWNNAGIKHGIYSGTAWDTAGPFTVGGIAQTSFSMVVDSSYNVYVLAESATGTDNVYKCSATCAGTWGDLTAAVSDSDCDAAYTEILYNGLTYDSTDNDLFAFIVASDGTNEKACFRRSTDMGVTWEATTYDLGYVSTDLAHISATEVVADPSKAAITLRDAAIYSFATVPEKSLILLLLAPFLPGILKKLKEKK
ncbi:MAG: glycosyltransferase [Candidatus Marinimicrobia bacterium]|nr:glycosyltransferase [Candidatus Neomarinimicrobiota bacterium]